MRTRHREEMSVRVVRKGAKGGGVWDMGVLRKSGKEVGKGGSVRDWCVRRGGSYGDVEEGI